MRNQRMTLLVAAAALIVVAWTGEVSAQQRGRGADSSGLTQAERAALVKMFDEEKLAHDVYVMLARSSRNRMFVNIAAAESRHMAALQQVAVRYRLSRGAVNNTVGRFANPDVAELYQELVRTGIRSPLDAFKVGAKIEEMDIADLSAAIAVTTHPDVRLVLMNLQRGSRNHLRAFGAAIRQSGGNYTAEYLPQEEFNRICNSPQEKGGMGQGNGGMGRGMGQGRGGMGRGQGMGRGRGGMGQGQGQGGPQYRHRERRGGRGGH